MSAKANQTERCLRIVELLAGHEFEGVTNGQLAEALAVAPSYITRDLALLRERGWAEEIPEVQGRWRLAPRPIRLLVAYADSMSRREQQIADLKNRYGG